MMDGEKKVNIPNPITTSPMLQTKTKSSNEASRQQLNKIDLDPLIKALRITAENSSTQSVFIKDMNQCLRILDSYDRTKYFHVVLFNSESFNDNLNRLICHSMVSEFTNRDYFSYDGSDFEGHAQMSECVLIFCVKLLSGIKDSNDDVVDEATEGDVDEGKSFSSNHVSQKLASHLPHILLTISGHANKPIWSSQDCQKYCLHLIQIILQLFNCTSITDLLSFNIDPKSVYPKIKKCSFQHSNTSLLIYLLHYFEEFLSKDRWERNPFLCESFTWLIKELDLTQLSKCINQVMAVSLNFLHNFDTATKMKGLHLLRHLIHSTSNEELRWYNRAEVIYEALKVHIYSKEADVLDAVIDCLFSVLKILEKPHIHGKRYHFVLSTLLSNAESENLLVLRRVYISKLAHFFLDCGALCIGHLSNSLRVIDNFLEVEDGSDELARLSALDALHNLILMTWPRITFYSETIIKFLLKFVISINSSSFLQMKTKGTYFKASAEDKVIICFNLLCKLNPDVKTCIEAVKKSDHQGYLTSLLEAWSLIDL